MVQIVGVEPTADTERVAETIESEGPYKAHILGEQWVDVVRVSEENGEARLECDDYDVRRIEDMLDVRADVVLEREMWTALGPRRVEVHLKE